MNHVTGLPYHENILLEKKKKVHITYRRFGSFKNLPIYPLEVLYPFTPVTHCPLKIIIIIKRKHSILLLLSMKTTTGGQGRRDIV